MCVHVWTRVEASRQHWVSSSVALHISFWDGGLSLSLEPARLTGVVIPWSLQHSLVSKHLLMPLSFLHGCLTTKWFTNWATPSSLFSSISSLSQQEDLLIDAEGLRGTLCHLFLTDDQKSWGGEKMVALELQTWTKASFPCKPEGFCDFRKEMFHFPFLPRSRPCEAFSGVIFIFSESMAVEWFLVNLIPSSTNPGPAVPESPGTVGKCRISGSTWSLNQNLHMNKIWGDFWDQYSLINRPTHGPSSILSSVSTVHLKIIT